jgi:hypothetical protein
MKHADIKPFQCAECGYASNMKSKVRRHMRVRHQTEDDTLIISQNIKFSLRSSDYLKLNHETTALPPIMKISYATREAANITMDEENNIQDTQIVQQFVIEEITPDTVIATHQCADCRFSCKTASALSLHKISYHSNSIVQIVNEEVAVKSSEDHDPVQFGSAQCVSGGPLEIPEVGNVQEVQYVVSGEDTAITPIVAAAEEASVDEQETVQSVMGLDDGNSSNEIVGLVAVDEAASDENQTVHLVQIDDMKPTHKRRTVRFVTMEDHNSANGQTIQMVIEDGSSDVDDGCIQYHDDSVEYVTIEGQLELNAIEQTEGSTSTFSDCVPVIKSGDTQIVTSASEVVSMSDVKITDVHSITESVTELIHILK